MTHPKDYSLHPGSQTGRGPLTQESGDACLSSNMEHTFYEFYHECAWPVAEKGSSVIPIPKEDLDVCYFWVMDPHAAEPKPHPVWAEERVVQINTSPPKTLSESPEEDTFQAVPPCVEEVGDESCFKMDTGPKCPPTAPGAGRIRNQLKKRAPGKYRKLYLLCWIAFILPVSGGDQPAADHEPACFTCKDKDRCPKLINIFQTHPDTHLYHRDPKATFPECSVISPAVHKCSVCCNQSMIVIICSKVFGSNIDVEDSDGIIGIIPIICSLGLQQHETPPNHQNPCAGGTWVVMISVFAFFLFWW